MKERRLSFWECRLADSRPERRHRITPDEWNRKSIRVWFTRPSARNVADRVDSGTAIVVGAGLLVIEHVMGNFVAPQMQGKQLAISPLVVKIALLLWS